MSTLSDFAKIVSSMSYRDLMEISEKLTYYSLDETHEIAEALSSVAESITSDETNPG